MHRSRLSSLALLLPAAGLLAALPAAWAAGGGTTDLLIVTIDTLRADRLSSYGYERPTSPNLDRLIGAGVRFAEARTVEPLTGPALCSMLTSLHPHESGATRNGLRMRDGLPSLPRLLQAEGYRTAAFVSNWTLRDKITGLGDHFEHYGEAMTRKRWMGLVSGEARADRINELALDWLEGHVRSHADRPFLLWVHYSEPHAPYELHEEHLERLGIAKRSGLPIGERYDTEVADVDRAAGELLEEVRRLGRDVLVAFTSDHGESLGEHGYWGHGRNLHEPGLRIPLSLSWPGRLEPGVIESAALNIDLTPTVLGLLGVEAPEGFQGYDWTGVLRGGEPPPDRITRHQAHRGAVLSRHDSDVKRRSGLLSVAVVQNRHKEILRVKRQHHLRFDLQADPAELTDLGPPETGLAEGLEEWMRVVDRGLSTADEEPPTPLDDETIERLRALGYAD
jgi:arylsulfatase A-like enzyme